MQIDKQYRFWFDACGNKDASLSPEGKKAIPMSGLDDLKFAALSPEDLETIRALEKKLGPGIQLVAVETKAVLYALEAKMAPNEWQRVDTVYPEIKDIQAYYTNEEAAREAKGWLKGFLISNKLNPKPKKRPIRIRQLVNTEKPA